VGPGPHGVSRPRRPLTPRVDAILTQLAPGGLGTLYGSVVGTVIAIGLREVLSTYTDNWLVYLGALHVVCVMCFPEGLTRLRLRSRRA